MATAEEIDCCGAKLRVAAQGDSGAARAGETGVRVRCELWRRYCGALTRSSACGPRGQDGRDAEQVRAEETAPEESCGARG